MDTKKKRKNPKILPLTYVPEIGVEPTRREALAPETSVSTISPLGLAKAGQRYKFFLKLKAFARQLSHSNVEYIFLIPLFDRNCNPAVRIIHINRHVLQVRSIPVI